MSTKEPTQRMMLDQLAANMSDKRNGHSIGEPGSRKDVLIGQIVAMIDGHRGKYVENEVARIIGNAQAAARTK
jgi:hypothetical protein